MYSFDPWILSGSDTIMQAASATERATGTASTSPRRDAGAGGASGDIPRERSRDRSPRGGGSGSGAAVPGGGGKTAELWQALEEIRLLDMDWEDFLKEPEWEVVVKLCREGADCKHRDIILQLLRISYEQGNYMYCPALEALKRVTGLSDEDIDRYGPFVSALRELRRSQLTKEDWQSGEYKKHAAWKALEKVMADDPWTTQKPHEIETVLIEVAKVSMAAGDKFRVHPRFGLMPPDWRAESDSHSPCLFALYRALRISDMQRVFRAGFAAALDMLKNELFEAFDAEDRNWRIDFEGGHHRSMDAWYWVEAYAKFMISPELSKYEDAIAEGVISPERAKLHTAPAEKPGCVSLAVVDFAISFGDKYDGTNEADCYLLTLFKKMFDEKYPPLKDRDLRSALASVATSSKAEASVGRSAGDAGGAAAAFAPHEHRMSTKRGRSTTEVGGAGAGAAGAAGGADRGMPAADGASSEFDDQGKRPRRRAAASAPRDITGHGEQVAEPLKAVCSDAPRNSASMAEFSLLYAFCLHFVCEEHECSENVVGGGFTVTGKQLAKLFGKKSLATSWWYDTVKPKLPEMKGAEIEDAADARDASADDSASAAASAAASDDEDDEDDDDSSEEDESDDELGSTWKARFISGVPEDFYFDDGYFDDGERVMKPSRIIFQRVDGSRITEEQFAELLAAAKHPETLLLQSYNVTRRALGGKWRNPCDGTVAAVCQMRKYLSLEPNGSVEFEFDWARPVRHKLWKEVYRHAGEFGFDPTWEPAFLLKWIYPTNCTIDEAYRPLYQSTRPKGRLIRHNDSINCEYMHHESRDIIRAVFCHASDAADVPDRPYEPM